MRYVRTDTYKIYDDLRCTRAVLLRIDSYWVCANISITPESTSLALAWNYPNTWWRSYILGWSWRKGIGKRRFRSSNIRTKNEQQSDAALQTALSIYFCSCRKYLQGLADHGRLKNAQLYIVPPTIGSVIVNIL